MGREVVGGGNARMGQGIDIPRRESPRHSKNGHRSHSPHMCSWRHTTRMQRDKKNGNYLPETHTKVNPPLDSWEFRKRRVGMSPHLAQVTVLFQVPQQDPKIGHSSQDCEFAAVAGKIQSLNLQFTNLCATHEDNE